MADIWQSLVDGMQTFVSGVLPWLIVVLVILIFGYIVARIAKSAAKRLVVQLRLEQGLAQAGVTNLVKSIGFGSIGHFFGALVFWFVFLLFLLLAISFAPATNTGLDSLLTEVAFYIPKFIAGALIVVAGVWVGTWLAERVKQPSIRSEMPFPPEIIGGFLKFIAIAMAGIVALNLILGPGNVEILTWTATVAIAALFIGLGASLAFGSRHLSANLSGYLQVSRAVKAGDQVEIGDVKGTVLDVNRYAVVVKDDRDREVTIPNGTLLQQTIVKTGHAPVAAK